VTIQARLTSTVSAEQLRDELRQFYAGHRFIHVSDAPPRLKDVVGSNYCHLGVAVKDDSVAVFSVIDNLVKGAAGGAMQWMNRKLDIDEYAGLEAPGPAWL
jgi:N-acetyl-gamma-glutamyl-phosphate reductase